MSPGKKDTMYIISDFKATADLTWKSFHNVCSCIVIFNYTLEAWTNHKRYIDEVNFRSEFDTIFSK